jgi:hypothetical protein
LNLRYFELVNYICGQRADKIFFPHAPKTPQTAENPNHLPPTTLQKQPKIIETFFNICGTI